MLALLPCLSLQAAPAKGRVFTPPGARVVTIVDQNMYVGSEFDQLLTLDPTDPQFPVKLLMGVAEIYQTIIASDVPQRAAAVAQEIAATRPELVSLQEASLIRIQVPGDIIMGGTTPATDVQLDYVGIVLANLQAQGLHYVTVAIATNMDIELPMPTTDPAVFADVRLTDHDVILARADLPPGHLRVTHPQQGNFQTSLSLGNLGLTLPRGWCSVDVSTRGRTFRFINAHLEENTSPEIQLAQAQELLAGPVNTPLPVILTGDFNSDAYGHDGTTTYSLLTHSLADTWSVVNPGSPGLTWGHDPLLADPTVAFIWRLDLVLYRGAALQPLQMMTLTPTLPATPPLWPSDHAGLVARFRIR